MTRVLDALLFGLLYATVVGVGDPRDWLTGIVVGAMWPRPMSRRWRASDLADLPRFAAGLALAVVEGGASMLRILVRGLQERRTNAFEEPFEDEMTETGAAALTFAISISPGTAVSELDPSGRRLRIDAIDAREPVAVRAWMRRFYARHQRRIFR